MALRWEQARAKKRNSDASLGTGKSGLGNNSEWGAGIGDEPGACTNGESGAGTSGESGVGTGKGDGGGATDSSEKIQRRKCGMELGAKLQGRRSSGRSHAGAGAPAWSSGRGKEEAENSFQ
ncbi:hypothetical protein PR202_gb14563 [Eleusine coracana subsp. coracana]|uniref:Uncharacterized protein n=1 Tax=Eleusine coracana subsp. coracana TaxID=191504 RepID=A0AAV5EW51_ELECO|nr:hypothetical protein PR202_gb14563 [Eleusine coracana subsp. coracana]